MILWVDFDGSGLVIAGLGEGFDSNDEKEFKDGQPPLYWAARRGHVAVVEALCDSGAQPLTR